MQYTQQDLQKMRERAIQGAFEMQKKAQLRQNAGKKPEPQIIQQPKTPQIMAEPQKNGQNPPQETVVQNKQEQTQALLQIPQASAFMQQHTAEKARNRQRAPQNIQTEQKKEPPPNTMQKNAANGQKKQQPQQKQTPLTQQGRQQPAMQHRPPESQKPQAPAPNQWVEKLKAAEAQKKAMEAQQKFSGMPPNPKGPVKSGGRERPTPNAKREEKRPQEQPVQGCQAACPVGRVWQNRKNAGTQEDSDSMLILFLVMLLMQEGADQSLLFSLFYILL